MKKRLKKRALRGWLQSKGSSLFGIILAAFRFQTVGAISTDYIAPTGLDRKSAQKNPKIDRTLRCKHPLTLLEIMIVICLITLITGVIGYNMKGSLDKGKAFRTEQARDQLHDMLLLALSEGEKIDDILARPKEVLAKLGLARDPDNLLKDGWNQPFSIRANRAKTDFKIVSRRLIEYQQNLAGNTSAPAPSNEEEQ